MHPYLIQTESFTVAAYPFFYGLALVISCVLFAQLSRRRGIPFRTAVNVWFIVAVAIIIGGRLLFILVHSPSTSFLDSMETFQSGGEALYGALACGMLAGVCVVRFWRLPLLPLLDAAAVSTPLGIAVGRIGCLMQGCCHGSITDGPLGVRYPKQIDVHGHVVGSLAYLRHLDMHRVRLTDNWSAPVHPVQVYESLYCVLLSVILYLLWRRRRLHGRLFCLMAGLYAVWRFTIEFLRVHERSWFGALTVYQVISILFGSIAFLLLVALKLPSPQKSAT